MLCGAGCSAVEGEEECHTKVVDNLIIMMRKYINCGNIDFICHSKVDNDLIRMITNIQPSFR